MKRPCELPANNQQLPTIIAATPTISARTFIIPIRARCLRFDGGGSQCDRAPQLPHLERVGPEELLTRELDLHAILAGPVTP
ncbi:hypothetical protein NL676_019681 [Syzygium grande]|nr:hypothetical protein NL676_019681 [Syzygium grande]